MSKTNFTTQTAVAGAVAAASQFNGVVTDAQSEFELVREHYGGDWVQTGFTCTGLAGVLTVAAGIAYVDGHKVTTGGTVTFTGKATHAHWYVQVDNASAISTIEDTPDAAKLTLAIVDWTDGAPGTFNSITDLRAMQPISLGTGADNTWAGQLNARIHTYTTNHVAATEDPIAHGLGRTPVGFLVISRNGAGTIYKSTGTAWNATNIYLMCDVIDMPATIMVF